MRFLRIFIFLICAFVMCQGAQADTILHDTNGGSIDVSTLKGKWVVLNYWADWCDICMKETSELNNFYSHSQNKNIVLYGVNYDHMPLDELKAAMARIHISYPVIQEDPTQVWPLEVVDVLPVTYIIDPRGKVVKRILGASTEASLLAIIHQMKKA